ncbi:membrane-spanning 4-domains subfamily A member 13 isoform 1-T1 [Molossus nigricans]
MAPRAWSKLSTADALALGAIQILMGIFHVFMWYFLLTLYIGQTPGVFGIYSPITYQAGCSLWGVVFILSGALIITVARIPYPCLITGAIILNILSILLTMIAVILTVVELSTFHSLSYRNYGQAKLGREVSRVLLLSYPLEFVVAVSYSILTCSDLGRDSEDNFTTVTDEAESSF